MTKKRRRRPKCWSYTAGQYPNTVRVYERGKGGIIYASVYDTQLRNGRGGEHRMSLGHRDRDMAIAYADDQAKKLREGMTVLRAARPTVERVFRVYRAHRTPDKSAGSQVEDGRQMQLWTKHLGAEFDLSRLSRREWDSMIRGRKSGAIGSRGELVSERRRRVRDRTVQRELVLLRAVCRWACDFRDADGRLLMERDPTRGLQMIREKNPTRSVATHDRVEQVREHYREPTMRIARGGRREVAESYLPEIFEIVVGTGRRISAVCGLRYEDLELTEHPTTPHGAIVWPSDTDKMGKQWRCPINAAVRRALDVAILKRQAVGPGPLFPSPSDRSRPLRYEQASAWLRQAENDAGLKRLPGTLWHAYRRLWASARKDLPDMDVAQAGGWRSLEALKSAYQQPDDATMLRVVTHEAELREVR